ncbi:MAG: hypothetical protein GY759_14990 [Chloroflexi bacterium]|nr:hypothetical protein [Chloroflexota bacterium]
MDKQDIDLWIQGYIRAWTSNDPEEIGDLFAENGSYRPGPFDEPWQGRDAIVRNWLNRRDEPDQWSFEYEVLTFDPPVGVVQGWTTYHNYSPPRHYGNLWIVKVNGEGRCTEFWEYWMKRGSES